MKRITLALAIVASLVVLAPAQPAAAHGACAATSRLTILAGTTSYVKMDAGAFCTIDHVSTKVTLFLHVGSRTGAIIYSDSASCSNCKSVGIERFLVCTAGQRYVMQVFAEQRQDFHNITSKWSTRVTCPVSG